MHQCIAVPLILAATQDQPAVRVNLRLHSQPMLCPCCRRLSRVNRAWAANEGRAASTNHVSRREQELLEKWLRAWEEQEKNQFFKLIKAVDKGRPFDYTLVCTRPPPPLYTNPCCSPSTRSETRPFRTCCAHACRPTWRKNLWTPNPVAATGPQKGWPCH